MTAQRGYDEDKIFAAKNENRKVFGQRREIEGPLEDKMESAASRIPARSRRQAMDWSLALVSQGIETTIEHDPDGSGWGLTVRLEEFPRAVETLRQYEIENRRWRWRHRTLLPGLLFDWASVVWVVLMVTFYWLDNRAGLASAGLMSSAAIMHGQWWRLFTAVWLHADAAHLASNATIGFVLLGLAMGRYGSGAALLAAYLAGAGGNLIAATTAIGPRFSLGSSGMVMGALGLLAVQSLHLWRQAPDARKYILSGICGGILLLILLGFAPGTDTAAHCGGFLCGMILGGLMNRIQPAALRPKVNLLCGLLFVLLTVLPWWLALRKGGGAQ